MRVELLGSSKKFSICPANKCLRDWFFKYFPYCPQWISSRSNCFGVTSYQKLVYPDWYIHRLFISFLEWTPEIMTRRQYNQIRISVTWRYESWPRSRINELYQIHFRYYFNLWYNPLPPSPWKGALDAEKLDKTSASTKNFK